MILNLATESRFFLTHPAKVATTNLSPLRLTGDIQWPASTPFEKAIGPLAGSFPILSLRTNKADVVVGVDQDVADRLDVEENRKWRYDGR